MDQEIRRNNDHSDHYVVKIEMILFNMNHIEIFELERDPDEMYHWSKLRLCITSFRSLFEAAAQFYNNQEDYPEGEVLSGRPTWLTREDTSLWITDVVSVS